MIFIPIILACIGLDVAMLLASHNEVQVMAAIANQLATAD